SLSPIRYCAVVTPLCAASLSRSTQQIRLLIQNVLSSLVLLVKFCPIHAEYLADFLRLFRAWSASIVLNQIVVLFRAAQKSCHVVLGISCLLPLLFHAYPHCVTSFSLTVYNYTRMQTNSQF